MSGKAEAPGPLAGRDRWVDALPYAFTAGAVFLAWQVILQPVAQRAPVEIAVRVAPTSPSVLRRAAEAEFAAGRDENAAVLAREALGRAPFDVRALRVVGLTEARAGRSDQANEILTLAGNWSLRDDPSHAWLVEHRLRRGDYGSALAHADTLVRRREDIKPQVFRLFATAASMDPQRALPVLTNLLAADPPWREAFMGYLHRSPEGLQTAANLAFLLQSSAQPLSDAELGELYSQLLNRNPAAVRALQVQLNRPSSRSSIVSGDFDQPAPRPFQWNLFQGNGVAPDIVDDDLRPGNPALRVTYDGYTVAVIAEQALFLTPGSYRLAAETRVESGEPAGRFAWTLTCAPQGGQFADMPVTFTQTNDWRSWSARFAVPAGCSSQVLRLEGRAADRRLTNAVWFDKISILPAP